jgi:2,4-diketo-3-deoxy-L-fuconate hydrolase
MRLCRFVYDGLTLVGFFADDHVLPIAQAAEAYGETHDEELILGEAEDLLPFLPPDGPDRQAARTLAGWVEGLDNETRAELAIPIGAVTMLPPVVRPGKVLLPAGNYAAHVVERQGTPAERAETFPYLFLKPTTAIIGPDEPIRLPANSPDQIDWECELAVVLGARCRDVAEADALAYVAGYTILNDVTDRKFTPNPGRTPRERDKFFDWLHGKWPDTFCPIGPCLLSADALPDPQGLSIRLAVNGAVKQDGNTGQMVFPVAALIAFARRPGRICGRGTWWRRPSRGSGPCATRWRRAGRVDSPRGSF